MNILRRVVDKFKTKEPIKLHSISIGDKVNIYWYILKEFGSPPLKYRGEVIGILEYKSGEEKYHVRFENSQGETIESFFSENEISNIVEERNSKIDEILK